jgi:hypothetical protein
MRYVRSAQAFRVNFGERHIGIGTILPLERAVGVDMRCDVPWAVFYGL